MPGYGIAEAKGGLGLLSWRWAEERIEKAHTYYLATSDAEGKPHIMPIWAVWFNNALFFSTGSKSRKARNLALNHQCSIALEIPIKKRKPKKNDVNDSIIIQGVAERTDDRRTRKKFCALYQDKYDWDMTDFLEPIYRVQPQVIFGFTSEFTQTATRWIFS